MPTPPTLISYTEVAWNTSGGSKATASISWQTGDVVVVVAISEDTASTGTPALPTASGLTFVSQVANVAASACGTRISAVVAGSNGSGAVTVTNANTAIEWGFGVWVWRGSAGIGNNAEQHTATLTVALTPTGADSAIVWGVGDFAAAALQTITPSPTNTRQRVVNASRYTLYVADLADQVSSGSVNYGISGSGSGPFSIVALEIKAAASGGLLAGIDFTPGSAPTSFQPNQVAY